MLKKGVDPYVALLEYHATPLANGCSPAELLLGRKIKTLLPQNPSNLKPKLPNFQFIKRKESVMRKKAKLNHDTKKRARDLPPLASNRARTLLILLEEILGAIGLTV